MEYSIESKDGLPVVVDELGNTVEYNRLSVVFKWLKEGYRTRESAEMLVKSKNFQWVFPNKHKDIFMSGQCVYFLTRIDSTEYIKIGSTQALANRVRALRDTLKTQVSVIAFAKTSLHKNYERALHEHFHQFRLSGTEWFHQEPVLQYINAYRSL